MYNFIILQFLNIFCFDIIEKKPLSIEISSNKNINNLLLENDSLIFSENNTYINNSKDIIDNIFYLHPSKLDNGYLIKNESNLLLCGIPSEMKVTLCNKDINQENIITSWLIELNKKGIILKNDKFHIVPAIKKYEDDKTKKEIINLINNSLENENLMRINKKIEKIRSENSKFGVQYYLKLEKMDFDKNKNKIFINFVEVDDKHNFKSKVKNKSKDESNSKVKIKKFKKYSNSNKLTKEFNLNEISSFSSEISSKTSDNLSDNLNNNLNNNLDLNSSTSSESKNIKKYLKFDSDGNIV